MIKRFMIALVCLLLIPITAVGAEDEYNEYIQSYDLSFFEKSLGKDTYALLEELGVENFDYEQISALSVSDVWRVLLKLLKEKVKSPLGGGAAVLLYLMLSALFQSFRSEGSRMNELFSTVSALLIALVLIVKISPVVTLAASTVGVAADFIYAFVPAFCAIVAASGGITVSFSANAMLLMLSEGLGVAGAKLFLPAVNCFLSIGICAGLRAELRLSRLVSSLKKLITTALSLLAGGFVSVLSVKTTVGAKADYLGLRSVRFVISSVVPVIGGQLSEGLLSIQSYSSMMKTSVGIVGIIAVVLVFLPAALEVLLWRVMLTLCLTVSDIFDDKSVAAVLTAFRDTLLLMSVVLVVAVMTTVISIGLLIAARTG